MALILAVAAIGALVRAFEGAERPVPAGTVKDINPGKEGSDIRLITTVGDGLYFSADDGTRGGELWRSDGTRAGTVLVKDINPGTGGLLAFPLHCGTEGEICPRIWSAPAGLSEFWPPLVADGSVYSASDRLYALQPLN